MGAILDIIMPVVVSLAGTLIAALAAWAFPKVNEFFAARRDAAGWELLHNVVWAAVQGAEQLNPPGTGPAKKAAAVRQAVSALTSSGHRKQVERLAGRPIDAAVGDAVEANVNKLRAQQKAVEAGSVSVGPS